MADIFQLVKHDLQIRPGVRLIKADEWAAYCAAEDVLRAARGEAEEIMEQAREAYAREKTRGYEDGVLEGRMEHAESMLETVSKAVDYIGGLEDSIVVLVSSALRKILGELPPEERIVGVVRHALAMVQGQKKVSLRVAPGDEAAVSARLDELLRRYSSIKFIDVMGDSRLSEGDCLLESEMGVIDAGLETQIKAIANTLEKRQKG